MASKVRSVMAGLKAALEKNYANTVYPPDRVQVVLFWPDEAALNPGWGTIYLVRPGDLRGGPGPESCTVTESLQVLILALRRYRSASDDPFKENPPRWEVSSDLVADVLEKLRQDDKLGGQALTVFEGSSASQVAVDHERFLPNWVVPEIRIVVRYRYDKSSR